MSRIVSALPGRIRIRDRALRDRARLARIEEALAGFEGIDSLQPNPRAGSLVLHFDAARVEIEALEAAVDAAIDAELARPHAPRRRSLKMQVNRGAKLGMLGSLAASLALAAAGKKSWHAVTGGLFVACLGVHLAVHRRSILR
ncbi:HMA2 domain-containing protein [Azotobacter beijerinckii]|uniref:Uncharacterized protein n=1 Tax=Azotobacter beijerinckii TaxID=170623 RepID=A0A1H6QLY2_9GAMM|nr:cation transporter [Azotobacter beijerinckii]MDV7212067.1 cation transporter [Azotobacter beijerinckii]SEI40325.1 hypothetical protein SAMN04244579_00260 [Azotobacter beijerinckii]SER40434.1 hypothetical protein SAMN04244573_03560 [Azotobacter beijerinckii]SFB63255.1 hypothetical protein SAMN04244571_04517 [Azotobacter beijerinckii]SFL47295.1 hypothetical protein SAMN04244574_04416 [Azotobacter beijerinckii]